MQKKFREFYLDKLNEIQINTPNNPILISECFDFICNGCPANRISLFNNEVWVTLHFNRKTMRYDVKTKNKDINGLVSEGGIHMDVVEIYKTLSTDKVWNINPEKYGTDECLDGGHIFYTVYYPNKRIESMYMRCWLPKSIRSKRK
ncbi:hypothetical protein [Aquimarina sp. 433]